MAKSITPLHHQSITTQQAKVGVPGPMALQQWQVQTHRCRQQESSVQVVSRKVQPVAARDIWDWGFTLTLEGHHHINTINNTTTEEKQRL